MTYSIVALDDTTGELGVAVQTHQMCVGSGVPWIEAGVGAIATQAMTNMSFGPMGLSLLRHGVGAERALQALVASDEGAPRRQVAMVDAGGRSAAWTGEACIPYAGHRLGHGFSVQANMMLKASVPDAMAETFESAQGTLAERMLAALQAGQAEGGDIRGMQSAALQIRGGARAKILGHPDWRPILDLRVDEHATPLDQLARLVRLRQADLTSRLGDQAMESGDKDTALIHWAQARAAAPELEELAFWQALTLADNTDDPDLAADILAPVLSRHPLRPQWIELIHRLARSGTIERPGAAEALLGKLGTTSA